MIAAYWSTVCVLHAYEVGALDMMFTILKHLWCACVSITRVRTSFCNMADCLAAQVYGNHAKSQCQHFS